MKIRHLLLCAVCVLAPLLQANTTEPGYTTATATEHPFFRTDLYPSWSRMTPQQALTDVKAAIEEARGRLAAIAAVTPQTATFDNTFLAWYEAGENLKQVMNYVNHLNLVLGDREMQVMTDSLMKYCADYRAEGLHSARIATVLREAAGAPWISELSPARQRFVNRTLAQLTDNGLYLTPEKQQRKAELEHELARLGFLFGQYVRKSPELWELEIRDPELLRGMPEPWMKRSAEVARERGHADADHSAWVVNLHSAHADVVLRYCQVEETRRMCWQGINSAGTALTLDTEPIIVRILELRHELANLLGYDNFADKEAAHRMMGSGEKALAFINEMLAACKPAWDAYVAEELARLSRACGKELTQVNPWDVPYLNRHLPPARSSFNVNELTPYFQAEKVISGLMNIWAGLLNLHFEELPTICLKPGESCPDGHVEVWFEGVRCFSVKDATTGTHFGSFYMDLYTRPGKRSMAWCIPLRDGTPNKDGSVGEPHLAALVTNFAPPRKGQPHLLNHGDLYMLFHEFGHIMHMMLGHGELRAHCTAEVERDFVEMPSHLQENWIWEPEVLATFASHYRTGEPIPVELAEQLAASRGSNPIEMHMRMLLASKLDLEFHLHYNDKYKGRSIDEVSAEILAPWLFPYTEQPPTELRTLTYTMTEGYAACLYTYKWCEAMAADAFCRFRREGLLNPATGAEYRRFILERGSSIPAAQQISDFLGREPRPDALLELYTTHP